MITRRLGRRHIIATALATLMLVCLTGCFATPFGRASIFEVFKPSHRREHQTPEQVHERRERAWAIRRWTDERHALSLKIRDALRDHERWPTHAAMLVAEGYLEPDDFVLEGSLTDPSQIRVGHTDLATLPTLPLDERRAAAQAAADALPDDVVAHRLGDFVFMHQRCRAGGEELPARQRQVALSRLRSVVASPDPDFNPRGTPRHYWDLWERLRGWGPHVLEQNKRRGELGLAPIPQPRTVKHGKPATAPSGSHRDDRHDGNDERGSGRRRGEQATRTARYSSPPRSS